MAYLSSSSRYSVIQGTLNDDYIYNDLSYVTVSGGSGNDTINNGSSGDYSSLSGGNGNDYINAGDISWKVTLNGGWGNDTLTGSNSSYYGDVFQFGNHDDFDVITNYSSLDTIHLTGEYDSYDYYTVGNDYVISLSSDGEITVKGAADKKITIRWADGIVTTVNDGSDPTPDPDPEPDPEPEPESEPEPDPTDGLTYNSSRTAVTITSDYESNELSSNDYDDSVVTINASSLSDADGIEITGNENNNSIIGGKGDDTLDGGDGNDILTGGSGKDTFIFSRYEGNDVITDYKPGEDTIEFASAYNDYKANGSDVVFTVGSNTLTVKNGAKKDITVTDEDGNDQIINTDNGEDTLPVGVKYNNTQTTLTISKKFTDDEIDLEDYADTVKKVNATAAKNGLTITANENDNVITVGKKASTVYGGAGDDQITGGKGADYIDGGDDNDSLNGGSGNDTLVGGDGDDTMTGKAGKDVFVYDGNGDDVITDYKTGQDTIYLADDVEFESVTVKGKNVTFNLDGGSLTVKNAKNKKITFVDEDGEVISNDKYKKSATFDTDDDDERDFVESIDEPWFAQDNNFIKNDTSDIDTILNSDATNYNAGKIDTANVLTDLAQNKQSISNIVYNKNNK